jgi:ABC-type antimicrobial peptide transport system permease subunit
MTPFETPIRKIALLPTGVGIVGGLFGGLALTRGFDRWLFLSDPWDPGVVAANLSVLVVAAIGSSLVPALRASRVDLVRVLSSD